MVSKKTDRQRRVVFLVSDAQYAKMKRSADNAGMQLGAWLRYALFGAGDKDQKQEG